METLSDVSSGEDRYRPSFFELAAQEQLRDLLQPVVRYLLSILATRYPRYFLRFSNKHEETYLALMFFVESHYLKTVGGSFAENFYGMKRRRRPGVSSERAQSAVELFTDHEKLRKKELRWSLLFLIGIPYLRTRLDDLHEQMGGSSEGDLFGDRPQAVANVAPQPRRFAERLRMRLALLFKLLWPRFTKAYEYVLLGYNVAYLFDKTPYYRPWLHWLGVDLRRMSDQDYRKAEAAQAALRTLPFSPDPSTGLQPTTVQTVLRILKMAPQLLLSGLKVALPASIFLFKFLEWWSSSSYARNRLAGSASSAGGTAGAAAPALRAPSTRVPAHPHGVLGKDGLEALPVGSCPICRNAVTNPTALPTGYVGDYRCLFDYVEKEGRCPVTRLKVASGDLRKING